MKIHSTILLFVISFSLGGCFSGSVASRSSSPLPSEQLANAYSVYQAGDTQQAEKLYQQTAHEYPEIATSWFYLGNLAFRRGAVEEAQQHYLEAARRDPYHAETQYNLSMLNLRNAENGLANALKLTTSPHEKTLIRHQLDWLTDFPKK